MVTGSGIYLGTDGIITNQRDLVLSIQVSDCIPIFISDVNSGVIGLIHAGWRGIAANIIENGTSCPGTPLDSCSDELLRAFEEADLIISKGQGNFETLSESRAEIFFLLTIKCSVVGEHLAKISGTSQQNLSGNGELVLFHYNGKG